MSPTINWTSKAIWGKILLVTGIFFLLLTGISYFQYQRNYADTLNNAIAESIKQADIVTDKVHARLVSIEKFANEIATTNILSLPTRDQVGMIREVMKNNEDIHGIGLIYDEENSASQPDILISRASDTRILLYQDSAQWLEERNWYESFKKEQSVWCDSVFKKGLSGTPKIQLGKLIGSSDQPDGAIFFHLSISDVELLLNSAKLGNAGYAFIINDQGKYIYHPVDSWVMSGKTIYNSGYGSDNSNFKNAIDKAMIGEKELIEFNNPLNGLDTWYFFERIPGTS